MLDIPIGPREKSAAISLRVYSMALDGCYSMTARWPSGLENLRRRVADYNFSAQNYWDAHIKEIRGVARRAPSVQQHNETMDGPLILI